MTRSAKHARHADHSPSPPLRDTHANSNNPPFSNLHGGHEVQHRRPTAVQPGRRQGVGLVHPRPAPPHVKVGWPGRCEACDDARGGVRRCLPRPRRGMPSGRGRKGAPCMARPPTSRLTGGGWARGPAAHARLNDGAGPRPPAVALPAQPAQRILATLPPLPQPGQSQPMPVHHGHSVVVASGGEGLGVNTARLHGARFLPPARCAVADLTCRRVTTPSRTEPGRALRLGRSPARRAVPGAGLRRGEGLLPGPEPSRTPAPPPPAPPAAGTWPPAAGAAPPRCPDPPAGAEPARKRPEQGLRARRGESEIAERACRQSGRRRRLAQREPTPQTTQTFFSRRPTPMPCRHTPRQQPCSSAL